MKRILTIVLGILIIAGAFFLKNKLSSSNDKKKKPETRQVNVPAVMTREVVNKEIPVQVETSGLLTAKNRSEIFAEVQGIMLSTSKPFKEGIKFSKGQTLVKLDGSEFYASLQAQKSAFISAVTAIMPDLKLDYPDAFEAWDQYVSSFEISTPLAPLPEPVSSKEKLFLSGRNIYSTYYNVKNLELKYDKYRLRAPFSGMVTSSLVTPGTLIRAGQKLGEFVDPSVYELQISVVASMANSLSTGDKVLIKAIDEARTWKGEVARINGTLDQSSQMTAVYIEVRGIDLKEGQYLTAQITGKPIPDAFEIERNLLLDGNKVYVVNDSIIRIMPVTILHYNQETAIVKGLDDNTRFVSRTVPGLFDGMKVNMLSDK